LLLIFLFLSFLSLIPTCYRESLIGDLIPRDRPSVAWG